MTLKEAFVYVGNTFVNAIYKANGAVTLCDVSCNLSRNVLATLWRDKLHKTFHSVTYPETAKIVARQVSRKVKLYSTFGNGSCKLSHNEFSRCRVCYIVKCFVQLVPPQCCQNRHCEASCTKHFTVCSSARTTRHLNKVPFYLELGKQQS